jgi:hypothetical protein
VQYLVNRTERGWVVTLINNKGVYKPQQGLAAVDRSAVAPVSLSLRGKRIEQAREWTSDTRPNISQAGGQTQVKLDIPPGGVRIVELISSGQ